MWCARRRSANHEQREFGEGQFTLDARLDFSKAKLQQRAKQVRPDKAACAAKILNVPPPTVPSPAMPIRSGVVMSVLTIRHKYILYHGIMLFVKRDQF